MKPVEYHELSEDVQHTLAQLQNDVQDLQFEANIYRAAAVIAVAIAVERLWSALF